MNPDLASLHAQFNSVKKELNGILRQLESNPNNAHLIERKHELQNLLDDISYHIHLANSKVV